MFRFTCTILAVCLLCSAVKLSGQQLALFEHHTFSRYDTLRGKLTPERAWYDVHYYDLHLRINPGKQTIIGHNTIHYRTEYPFSTMQIDLFNNLSVDSIIYHSKPLTYRRDSHHLFVPLPQVRAAGRLDSITLYYSGQPHVAERAPWDGGFVWSADTNGVPWVGVACEGTGASLWWPNKDHLSEEPDSMRMTYVVPDTLKAIGNGQFEGMEEVMPGWTAWKWWVSYPINNYNVTVNIADYAHIAEAYVREPGDTLPLDYYVLSYNLDKARAHFLQVPEVLACLEHYFGPYPFSQDGYKLIEAPYLGMEHQSAIAYGNNFTNDLNPITQMGLKDDFDLPYDYIIVHETGHEWWGNSLSARDLGEMWLHEAFTTYAEALFVECRYDYEQALEYLQRQRYRIANLEPLLGPKFVNFHHWSYRNDLYMKGTWVLHTLRSVLNEDSLWFDMLYHFAMEHQQQHITTDQFIRYVEDRTAQSLQYFFDQYLLYPDPPRLKYYFESLRGNPKLHYRWVADVDNFRMPVEIEIDGSVQRLHPTTEWQTLALPVNDEDMVTWVKSRFYYEISQSD